MSASPDLNEHSFEPRRLPQPRRRWREARRAFEALMDDPDDTQRALDVLHALDPGEQERVFARFLAHPSGRRLYEARPSLREALDPAKLRNLPKGSLGRAYLAHLERWELDLDGLLGLNWDSEAMDESDAGLRWFVERDLLTHDLWHVLSGYGADDVGEAALLAFSLAQRGGVGGGFLTLGSALHAWRQAHWDWPRHVATAWRQGRRAADLMCVPYEELLAQPLDDVRRALGLIVPADAHGGRIPRCNQSAMQRRLESTSAA